MGLQTYSRQTPQKQARQRRIRFYQRTGPRVVWLALLPSHFFFHLLLYLISLLFYLLLRFLCFLFYLGPLLLHLLFYLGLPLLYLFFYSLLYLLLDRSSTGRCTERRHASSRNEN